MNNVKPVDECAPDCEERTTCPQVGGSGHWQCGTCPEHDKPRHHCGCLAVEFKAWRTS